jgi:hypothetical protein
MYKKTVILLFAPLLFIGQENIRFAETITKKDLEKHLMVLASDSLEGRETGMLGQKMAAEYIANHFKNIGIPPCVTTKNRYTKRNTTTYFQEFKTQSDRYRRLFKKKKIIEGENVLGYIEGTDLKDELVIITAHYDHLGKQDSLIFNGADDNGSGTAATLEIAEAFMMAKKDGNGPRRSVLIMPVSAEEKGLLGSKYYTKKPIFPLEKTVANLNIDMIGRVDERHDDGNYVYLIGSNRISNELHDISEQINKEYIGIELDYTFNAEDDPNRYYYRSDHYNFAKNNIPVIFYFNGTHEDYHKATDTIEKLDFEKIQKITRLIFLTAWELANRDERPKLNK